MKKVLSLILTLAMFISLIPAAFAAEPTEFTIDFTDVKIENLYVTNTNGTDKYFFQLKSKDGSVEYAAEGTNWSINEDTELSTLLQYTSTPIRFYLGEKEDKRIELGFTEDRISGYNSKKDDYSNPKGDAVVFDFTVPADGYYAVTAEVYKSMYAGKGYFYINNEETRSYDFYNAPNDDDSYGREPYVEIPITSKAIYLNEGENQIKVRAEYTDGDGDKAHIMLHSFTFTPVENATVSFVQTTNVDGHNDITVKSVERGASVTLTAHAKVIPGYEFVGWKRGSSDDDNSAWVDIDGDSYNVWTNTFLTAIYKPTAETAAKTVDFWNQNGAYMGTAADETSFKAMVAEEPSLTGFGDFLGWFTDGKVKLDENTELSNGTTNAVAQYEDGAVSGVTLNGNPVAEADTYNAPISLTESGVTYWMRGGKTIAYGDTYDFNVWAGTAITSHSDVVSDKVPVAILEYNDTYKAYMLEYDDGDYEIVEAGILFGGNMTVDNCTNKYTSQRKVSHNQFTVPAGEYTNAKGYIIWKNASGAYNIEYFSVAE
ncbi:MAG: hypothetical protein IJF32_13940 [Oscillospiraceae bacterium]|nr:hypothetical protein [Oscillospiraceae bacterium]